MYDSIQAYVGYDDIIWEKKDIFTIVGFKIPLTLFAFVIIFVFATFVVGTKKYLGDDLNESNSR
jgi:hypothetical protein